VNEFKVGDRVKVKDRSGRPGGYKIANREADIAEAKEAPSELRRYESR